MHAPLLTFVAAAFAIPAAAQLPSDIRELLKTSNEATRALEIKLHDANQEINQLKKELKDAREHPDCQSFANNAQFRDHLLSVLQRLAEEDGEVARALINKKAGVDIPAPPPLQPLPAGVVETASVRELLRIVNQRIRERELLIRALLVDRLGAAGQDMLESHASR